MQSGDTDDPTQAKTASVFKPGCKPEEVAAKYDDWSTNYEEMLGKGRYKAPFIAVEEAARFIPPEERSNTQVLDVAAGTGWVGRELLKEGFKHMDAVEPSKGMMKILEESGIYRTTFLEYIGTGESTVPADMYDLVVIAGGMGASHIPVCGIDDLVRVAKPGGLVVIVMRKEFLESVPAYKDKLEPYMDSLAKKGVWEKVTKRIAQDYFYDKDGIVFTYRVV